MLLYIYRCLNSLAFQYHESLLRLFTAGFQPSWQKSFTLENLSWKNFVSSLFVPFTRSVLDTLTLATWGDPPGTSCYCENCPFVPQVSTPSLWQHSLASPDSTVSLKVFDEGPCQISFGNTNRLYQLRLPCPHACLLSKNSSQGALRSSGFECHGEICVDFSTKYQIHLGIQQFCSLLLFMPICPKRWLFSCLVLFYFTLILLTQFNICVRLPWATIRWNSADSENKFLVICTKIEREKGVIPGEP